MPTTLTHGIQLPDKGSVDWYSSMQSNYNLIDTHLGDTDTHVTAEDKANWNSKQGSLSQAQLDAIAQVATNTSDIASLQSGKANASHTHSSSDITDIGDYATKQYVDNSISGLVDNAPDALNTLNELSTALNDDANFASTVTTALAAKANSADLATVATSGDYDDLSNKPSIPTNTSDLNNDSGFVTLNDFDIPSKTSDLTNDSGFITSSDVPTSTSDLTNDSNFVDTSNAAVASGITSTKVTDYDTHIADTDKHVTAADKQKWNNGVTQAYVLRYSSSSVTDNSTIAYSTLDNTDNVKTGDKVIDVNGKIFSVVSVDTANQTVTVGSALVDLAQDSDVVHTSGDETVGGQKTFANNRIIVGRNTDTSSAIQLVNSDVVGGSASGASGLEVYGSSVSTDNKIGGVTIGEWSNNGGSFANIECNRTVSDVKTSNTVRILIRNDGSKEFSASIDNDCKLGHPYFRWSEVYATNYYYGSNNVEFSTKFVTTDTAQTITGAKTFSDTLTIYNNDSSQATKNLTISSSKIQVGDTSNSDSFGIVFNAGLSYVSRVTAFKDASGTQNLQLGVRTKDSSNNLITSMIRLRLFANGFSTFESDGDNLVSLGSSSNKWKDVQTNQINSLEPSSLSLPSDRSARIDISSYFTNTGSTSTNDYSVPANGFIFLNLINVNAINCYSLDESNTMNYAQSFYRPVDGQIYIFFPIRKNDIFRTFWITSGTVTVTGAYFYPCLGNV